MANNFTALEPVTRVAVLYWVAATANAARPKCRKDGLTETLRASDQIMLQPGEAVIVTTPTAGGAGCTA